jgi:hypothetical protein
MRVSRGLYSLLFILIIAGLGGLAASCQPSVEPESVTQAEALCDTPVPITENETMNSTENEPVVTKTHAIPPIDAEAPDQTMTATFSLG